MVHLRSAAAPARARTVSAKAFCCLAVAGVLGLGALVTATATPVLAQSTLPSQARTDQALANLSEILGALSHLEALCDGPVTSREDMQALLASDELTPLRQSVLIDAFNRGFRAVASTHQRCTPTSRRLIERHHQRGAAIVASLLDE